MDDTPPLNDEKREPVTPEREMDTSPVKIQADWSNYRFGPRQYFS